jgi:flagellar motor switch protein FliN/FliY
MNKKKETDSGTELETTLEAGSHETGEAEGSLEMDVAESREAAERRGDQSPNVHDEFSVNIQRILDLQLPITVSFGTARKPLAEVLKLAPGSLVELDKSASDPVLLKVNNKVFAWGKVVDVDGYYGVEITEIIARVDRIATLGGF